MAHERKTYAAARSEAIPAAREPERIGSVLRALVGHEATAHFDQSQRAAAAWLMVNGDLERRHTVKVWLRSAPRAGMAPVMVVEVDSHPIIADFTAKRDLYLGRLAFYGQQVSRLEFRYTFRADHASLAVDRSGEGLELPDLSADDKRRVAELAQMVPDTLRPVVSSAIGASLRRQRRENRETGASLSP